MADEAPFQFLHQELIQYIYKSKEQGEVRHESDFFYREQSDRTINSYKIQLITNSHSLRKVEEISPN